MNRREFSLACAGTVLVPSSVLGNDKAIVPVIDNGEVFLPCNPRSREDRRNLSEWTNAKWTSRHWWKEVSFPFSCRANMSYPF